MTRGTSAGIEHYLPVGEIGLTGRQRSRRDMGGNGEPPEYAETNQRDQNQAKDRGIGGPILSASSYFMKSPPVQHNDDAAHELVEAFIRGDIER